MFFFRKLARYNTMSTTLYCANRSMAVIDIAAVVTRGQTAFVCWRATIRGWGGVPSHQDVAKMLAKVYPLVMQHRLSGPRASLLCCSRAEATEVPSPQKSSQPDKRSPVGSNSLISVVNSRVLVPCLFSTHYLSCCCR